MFSYVIWYLIIGTVLNFLYDLLVNGTGKEEFRFTVRERIYVAIGWPIFLIFFTWVFIKGFFN